MKKEIVIFVYFSYRYPLHMHSRWQPEPSGEGFEG